MTISYNWLHQYLPVHVPVTQLSEILTDIGLEVEAIEEYEKYKGGLKGLVVGYVVSLEKHPNADKLQVAKVDIGNNQVLQIVCGATNIAIHQKVIVATIGTTIYPTQGGELTMKLAKLRGVESYGMICAEDEVGLGTSHDGIKILDDSFTIGEPLATYFPNFTDTIFYIGITPNRTDAMSHWGVARDICAYLSHHQQQNIIPKAFSSSAYDVANNQSSNQIIDIHIDQIDLCAQYAAVKIDNIKVEESPLWLKNYLHAIGQKTINNVVDITNYILHATGQPLHAFDSSCFPDLSIHIFKPLPNTNFTTLDGKERKLLADDIVIGNKDKQPLCLAGVFGGLHSGVNKQTTSIILEAACFNPKYIRKTSIAHELRTEAAIRFEKGIDKGNTLAVLNYAIALIVEICSGKVVTNVANVQTEPIVNYEIKTTYNYINTLSGKHYDKQTIQHLLQALGFTISSNLQEEDLIVSVPTHKLDVRIPADIVEEIVRIDGINNIPIPKHAKLSFQANPLRKNELLKEKISNYLVGAGYHEILTNSIINEKYLTTSLQQVSVNMLNSLSNELNVMRPTMLYSGLEVIQFNINRKQPNLMLFEWGKTYTHQQNQYEEKEHVVLFLTGNKNTKTWNSDAQTVQYFDAKQTLQQLISIVTNEEVSTEQVEENKQIWRIHHEEVAHIHVVEKSVLQMFDIKQPVYYVDINFSTILKLSQEQKILYKEVSKYPLVERDIAFTLQKSIPFKQIEQVITQANIPYLKQYMLFDLFESEKLGIDNKSMALNFVFSSEERTLGEEDIDKSMQVIMKIITEQLSAEIRK